jgi:hypothetical protein
MQNALQRVVEPYLFANWKFLAFFLTFSIAWSLVRRFRLSRQSSEVNAVMKGIGFVPLDKIPIDRDVLKRFASPVGLGRAHNIVGGSVDGNEVVLFDSEVGNRNRQVALQTNAAFRLTSSNIPDFSLQPKNVLGKTLSMLGRSIAFEDDSSFSRDYLLTGVDEAGVRACFTPKYRAFFEGLERFDSQRNWHMQKSGDWILLYRKHEGVKPDELLIFLEGTAEIIHNLKSTSGNTPKVES